MYVWDPYIYSIGRNTKRYKVDPKNRRRNPWLCPSLEASPGATRQVAEGGFLILRPLDSCSILCVRWRPGDFWWRSWTVFENIGYINCNLLGLPHILQLQMRNMMMNDFDLRLYHVDHVEKYWRRCFHIAIFDYRGRICRPLYCRPWFI